MHYHIGIFLRTVLLHVDHIIGKKKVHVLQHFFVEEGCITTSSYYHPKTIYCTCITVNCLTKDYACSTHKFTKSNPDFYTK